MDIEQKRRVYDALYPHGLTDVASEISKWMHDGEVCTSQARHVDELIEKLEDEDMTVAVIGQFKRGKSTLSNVILGDKIMPVGIVPITSAVTRVRYGEKKAEVHFLNGSIKEVGFDELSKYISEQENQNNELMVKEVVLNTKSDFLKNGITYVDTPGVGSFHKNNTEVAYDHMKESDAVIFMLSVDSPINQIEIDFLYNTRDYAGKFYFAVNKIDIVSEEDLKAYMAYIEKLLRELMQTDDIKLYPISSVTGQGVEELKADIINDCDESIKEIMEESTKKKLHDDIKSALQQLNFYWKAMNMDFKELDKKFEIMEEFTASINKEAEAIDSIFEIHLNEIKMKLSKMVMEEFGMEYTWDIEQMGMGVTRMEKDEFLEKVKAVTGNLDDTLNRVLLYKEENAYKVVRRIRHINRVANKLRHLDEVLDEIGVI